MKPQKTCVYCQQPFLPYAFHIRRQRACSKPECQKQRRRETNRKNYRANKSDWDYRWEKREAWRRQHMKLFMREYRKDHPDYVKANRRQQQRRDRKKGNLVNSDVQDPVRVGKLIRIHVLESACKFRRIRLLSDGKLG